MTLLPRYIQFQIVKDVFKKIKPFRIEYSFSSDLSVRAIYVEFDDHLHTGEKHSKPRKTNQTTVLGVSPERRKVI